MDELSVSKARWFWTWAAIPCIYWYISTFRSDLSAGLTSHQLISLTESTISCLVARGPHIHVLQEGKHCKSNQDSFLGCSLLTCVKRELVPAKLPLRLGWCAVGPRLVIYTKWVTRDIIVGYLNFNTLRVGNLWIQKGNPTFVLLQRDKRGKGIFLEMVIYQNVYYKLSF